MKKIIRTSAVLLTVAILMSVFGTFALAAGQQDWCYGGWYVVNTVKPSGYTYSYIYDRPTSSSGKNLCRVDDGEWVYVYWREGGEGKKSSKWCYCEYDGIKGYIRWDNIVPDCCSYGY